MAPPAYEDIPLRNMASAQSGVAKSYGQEGARGIDFFKPKNGYQVYNRVLLGVAVALMAGMIVLGVALGKEKAHHQNFKAVPFATYPGGPHNYSDTTPVLGLTGLDLWNSTDCTTPGGNCTALLSKPQIDDCFQLVWDVCHDTYNDTHPIPLKNDTMFVDNPQCSHFIYTMHCNWESDKGSTMPCKAMIPFCAEEFLPAPELEPGPINTSGMAPVIATTVFTNPFVVTTTGKNGEVTTKTLLPVTTETDAFVKFTPTPSAHAAASLQTSGYDKK